ncbi:LysM peptidoglycan-binding domain-containing protein, partial [Sinorhizobium meliloti]
APEPSAEAAAAAEGPRKHVIVRGDTLWDLAQSFYGSGTEWKRISSANGDPAPRALEIGRELEIPAE